MAENIFWNAIAPLIVNSYMIIDGHKGLAHIQVNKLWNRAAGDFMAAWPNLKTALSKLFLNNLLFFPVYQVIRGNEQAAHWFSAQVHKEIYSVTPLNNITPYAVRIN